MGITSEYEKKKHEEAYAKGKEDAKNATWFDEVMRDFSEVIPVPTSSERDSYNQGWKDQRSGKNK